MEETPSERRLAENEVIFRQANETVQKNFNELEKLAKEDGQESFIKRFDKPLYFYCECSDEKCQKRVMVKPSKYNQIHKERDQFIMIPGHEQKDIEHVITKTRNYCVVKKKLQPPDSATELHKTNLDNT